MSKIVVVYHSGYGHTVKQAEAIAKGAMMQTPSDASADEVAQGDLETARLYGERIAQITRQFKS
ncbi:MAG: hypothetical protein ACR2IJ_01110 [Fluviibacter sp.]